MRLRHGFIAGIALMATGCASQDVMVQKQAEMESRLEYLVQSNKALTTQVDGLSNELRDLKERMENQSTVVRELMESTRGAESRTKGTGPDNGHIVQQQPAAPKIELINAETTPAEGSDTASADYMAAFGLYSANNYPAAIDAFKAFLVKHPRSEYAGNAQYWIGECHYSRSDLPRALQAFKKVVEKYPKGKKVPDALLKIGYTLFAMKEPGQAKATLASLIEKYPASPAAVKAQERLDK